MLDDVIVEDLRAVIIGINQYADQELPPLKSAVTDAESVFRYLQDDLGVPRSQIEFMKNGEATTRKVNDSLQQLAMDINIQSGAAIIIYFAGHSSRPTGSSMPVLATCDYKPSTNEGGIPYSNFLDMMQTISASKRNNITVILDTCFSGQLGRNEKFEAQGQSNVHPTPNQETTPPHESSRSAEVNELFTRRTTSGRWYPIH
ncbi:hypothetical protein B0H13DRAFT_1635333 [Mycena leptocephala]|nr:hypothetical protein B0H13DRAFT_1635333 [Mycena leptocephala]